ncbi:cell adhesion molecule CEACAM1-like [Anomaloglossus baeobatrachus]|uniref:cell adhesion molecule CEACAM1-like n=1 Tax=Anomaloglossus baeobatrachus TaxID=238106 RepID=UPI003F50A2C6
MGLNQVCIFLSLICATLALDTVVNLSSNSSALLWDGEDSAYLNCTSHMKADTFVWKLNGAALPEDRRYNVTSESDGLISILIISPVSRTDTGSFTCIASNATINETSNALSLNLAWSPDNLHIACNIESKKNNSPIQLSCSWVGGQPAADVTMIYNATEETAKNNITRDIPPTGDGNSITLLCEGVHLRANSSCNATVGRPQSTDNKNNTITSVKQGQTAVLSLSLQSGLYAQFEWFHHNPTPIKVVTGGKYKIESNETNSSLKISEVTSNEKGTYECIATTAIGNTSFTFKLDVSQALDTVVNLSSNSSALLWDGEDSAYLNCTSHIKAETFFWKLNGAALPEDRRYNVTSESDGLISILIISPVSRTDTGSFTCIASNATINETSNALSLNLAWSPDNLHIACNIESKKNNSPIQLSCSWVGGQPAADVTMIFNATEETAKNNITRDIPPTGDGNSITLLCEGVHLRANSRCNATVGRPQSTDNKNNTITSVKQGQTAVLSLSLQSGLYAQFEWLHHNPTPIKVVTGGKYKIESNETNSSLKISEVTSNEKGTYECIATTAIGSTSFTFKLDVSQAADSGLSGGAIAGIVIGVLAGVALIGVAVFFIVKKM